jgi:hypothetical protein
MGFEQSEDAAKTWRRIGELPLGRLDAVKVIEGDQNIAGLVYLGFGGTGFAYEGAYVVAIERRRGRSSGRSPKRE